VLRFPLYLLFGLTILSGDVHCPVYPVSKRDADSARLKLQRQAHAFSVANRRYERLLDASQPSPAPANFIDDFIFRKMTLDGVQPAPQTDDATFLRRVSLDLTGRIPSPDQIVDFVNNQDTNKRSALIDSLMGSDAFVDNWALFFATHFQVTSGYYNFIGIPGRNLFNQYLRDFIARDRSYAEVASELISSAGDSHKTGPLNFVVRGFQQGDPIQDTWDATTAQITQQFLGVQSLCVSCHNGARHLEPINLYLSVRRRTDFWGQSAFLSRTTFTQLPVDAFNQQWHFLLTDRTSGGYSSAVDPNNPGPRPARFGGPYTPVYMFTGQRPSNGNWRAELARIVTSDRQFARATVNFIWAHFFKYGIVDPPDGWDLARIDPGNPPPAPWSLQPSHPDLLEALADEFIHSNYSIRRIIRLIAQSNAYQLSSDYPGDWKVEYESYFAKHFPQRLSAEEIYDAVITATQTQKPMYVEGFDQPLYYASQLPDPSEPRNDGNIKTFLSNFGRGDWFQLPRSTDTNVLQVLYLMNDNQLNYRTFGTRQVTTRVSQLLQARLSDTDAVNQLFLATLGRWPAQDEFTMLQAHKTANYEQWLSDIQWTLLNKLDFIFNF
jgi:hypothetical protein